MAAKGVQDEYEFMVNVADNAGTAKQVLDMYMKKVPECLACKAMDVINGVDVLFRRYPDAKVTYIKTLLSESEKIAQRVMASGCW